MFNLYTHVFKFEVLPGIATAQRKHTRNKTKTVLGQKNLVFSI